MLVSILRKREFNVYELGTAFYKCPHCPPGYAFALHPVMIKVTEHVALMKKEVHFSTFYSAGLPWQNCLTAIASHRN